MIAESTPFGGIELKQASISVQKLIRNNQNEFGDEWHRWYGKVLKIINKYDVSMWCIINADWESQPMWHNVGFGETRIASNQVVMGKWQEQIIHNGFQDRKFLFAGSMDNCGQTSDNSTGILEDFAKDFEWDRLSHIGSFIIIPFLLVSAVFYFPFFILGGNKSSSMKSKKGERRHLLADLDRDSTVNKAVVMRSANFSTRSSRAVSPTFPA